MSIPKEPRQLMINLMYLVLTAMLALNVSAKIINAFFTLDKGIKASNTIIDTSNERVQSAIEKSAAQNAGKYQPVVDAGKKIKDISAGFSSYVESVRSEIAEAGGGYYPADDHHHPGQPKAYKNKDITTRILANGPKGGELEARIKDTKAQMLAVVQELLGKMGNVGQDPKTVLADLDRTMPLGISDEWEKEHSKSWAFHNFNQLPVAASWPLFTKFINDGKSSETACINFLAGLIGVSEIKVDAFVAVSSPIKSYVMEGEQFETELSIGAVSKSMLSNSSIAVNGSSVPVIDGIAHYKTSASGVGEKSYKVSISVKNPTTGEVFTSSKDFKYEVGRGSVAMELEDMNAVYIGVDNHLAISASGVSSNKVSCSASGGGMSLSPSGNFKYIVRATTPTNEASINVTADGKTYTKKVKVKRIPDPIAKLGGKHRGGGLPSGEFKAQMGIAAVLENFDFDAKCEIQGFGMFRVPKRSDAQPASNQGSRFGGSAATLIGAAVPGDMYLFENIKAKCPGDAASRDIGSMNFTVK